MVPTHKDPCDLLDDFQDASCSWLMAAVLRSGAIGVISACATAPEVDGSLALSTGVVENAMTVIQPSVALEPHIPAGPQVQCSSPPILSCSGHVPSSLLRMDGLDELLEETESLPAAAYPLLCQLTLPTLASVETSVSDIRGPELADGWRLALTSIAPKMAADAALIRVEPCELVTTPPNAPRPSSATEQYQEQRTDDQRTKEPQPPVQGEGGLLSGGTCGARGSSASNSGGSVDWYTAGSGTATSTPANSNVGVMSDVHPLAAAPAATSGSSSVRDFVSILPRTKKHAMPYAAPRTLPGYIRNKHDVALPRQPRLLSAGVRGDEFDDEANMSLVGDGGATVTGGNPQPPALPGQSSPEIFKDLNKNKGGALQWIPRGLSRIRCMLVLSKPNDNGTTSSKDNSKCGTAVGTATAAIVAPSAATAAGPAEAAAQLPKGGRHANSLPSVFKLTAATASSPAAAAAAAYTDDSGVDTIGGKQRSCEQQGPPVRCTPVESAASEGLKMQMHLLASRLRVLLQPPSGPKHGGA